MLSRQLASRHCNVYIVTLELFCSACQLLLSMVVLSILVIGIEMVGT